MALVLRGPWALPLLLLLLGAAGSCSAAPKLLLVSFDGFRWDYLRLYNASWFNFLRERGASTVDGSMEPTFTTKTFPSHFTLATGLFQESHGIISNNMFDPQNNSSFFLNNRTAQTDPFWWNGGIPIWIAAEMEGLRSGTYFWPGSEVPYNGRLQTISLRYNHSVPFERRVDTVVRWLAADSVDFATLYFHEPDTAGHAGGPHSEEVRKAVEQVNAVLGRLIQGLQRAGLFDSINLIVTSDHGMAAVNTSSSVIPLYTRLRNRTDLYQRMVNRDGPIVDLVPQPGKAQALAAFLRNLTVTWPHMEVFRRAEIPDRFHYKHNRRVPEVLVLAKEGFYLLGWGPFRSQPKPVIGAHGYSNGLASMRPVFMAHGPGFRPGAWIPRFRQVDLYSAMTHLLGIKGRPNNGSLANVKAMLRSAAPPAGPGLPVLVLALGAAVLRHLRC